MTEQNNTQTDSPIELKNIILWSQPNCIACDIVKGIFDNILKVPYTVKIIKDDISKEEFYKMFPNARTVPQIVINGNIIGGFSELQGMIRNGLIKTTNVV